LKGLFGVGSGEQEVLKDKEGSGRDAEGQPLEAHQPAKEKKAKGDKKDMDTIALEVNVASSTLPPMSMAEKRASRSRFATIYLQGFSVSH
jgi:hypoxia up-regulated 1